MSVIPLMVFSLLCLMVGFVESVISDDEVLNLPGLKFKPKFRQFSGYLNATGTRKLHYWFVESQGNPSKDPVILLLNGILACSSLNGFLTEHGPFLVSDDGKTLKENPYSWNKLSNIIYLEAPAGVGFSYSADKNYTTSDIQTALDNYWALKYFFSKYAEFSSNEFYIMGESYGGIYVPTLSLLVVADKSFNFQGFAIGNAYSDRYLNDDSLVYLTYYRGLLSERGWLTIVKACCAGSNSTVGNCIFSLTNSSACIEAAPLFQQAISNLNPFNLYDECCYYELPLSDSVVVHPYQLSHLTKLRSSGKSSALVPTCLNITAITSYLNIQAVRKALHIPKALPPWEICSEAVFNEYHVQYERMRKVYVKLLSIRKLRMMLFNGDVSTAFNFLGEEWFVNSLPLKVKDDPQQWFYNASDGSQQVAGVVQKFNNFTFLTIKGAGVMVAHDKPIQALEMLKRYLSGDF